MQINLSCIIITSFFSLPAIAAEQVYTQPKINQLPIDGSTWEYPGGNIQRFRGDAANIFCRSQGFDHAVTYQTEIISQKGTWRFANDGTGKSCGFCSLTFSSVTCGQASDPVVWTTKAVTIIVNSVSYNKLQNGGRDIVFGYTQDIQIPGGGMLDIPIGQQVFSAQMGPNDKRQLPVACPGGGPSHVPNAFIGIIGFELTSNGNLKGVPSGADKILQSNSGDHWRWDFIKFTPDKKAVLSDVVIDMTATAE